MTGPERHPGNDSDTSLSEMVERKASRKLRARRGQGRGLWYGLGLFGLIGWSVAIPTLVGVLLGLWLDGRSAGGFPWTLTLLFGGLVIGCVNAWFWLRREGGLD